LRDRYGEIGRHVTNHLAKKKRVCKRFLWVASEFHRPKPPNKNSRITLKYRKVQLLMS
jgi:hypothetical protein